MNSPTRYRLTVIILACLAVTTTAFCKPKKKGKGGKGKTEQTEVVPPTPASNETASSSPTTSAPAPPLPQISGILTTTSGKMFEAVAIKRIDPDGLLILHKDGVAKVLFTDVSEELRTKYGYDAQKASAFQATQKEAQAAEAARQAKERATEAEKQAEENRKKDQIKNAVRITGRVFQVVKDGIIVKRHDYTSTPAKGRAPDLFGGDDLVFITGHKRKDTKVDGDPIDVDASRDGMFSYTTTIGAEKRLAKYQVNNKAR